MSRLFSFLPHLLLACAIAVGWVSSFWKAADSAQSESIVEARIDESEDLKTYKNVIDEYDAAIAAHPDDIEWYKRKANAYHELEWYDSYISQCQTIMRAFPNDLWGYTKLMEYYVSESDFENVFRLYRSLPESMMEDEYLKSSYESFEYQYRYMSGAYEDADPLSWGYATVGASGNRGFVNASTRRLFDRVYEDAHSTLGDAAAVKLDGEWFLIDLAGDRIRASHDAIEDLYSPFEGRVLAKVDGKYGYYDVDLKNPTHFEYDDATSFFSGIAAVKKGEKWALIDSNFNEITEYKFDAVLTDYAHVCSRTGMVFAKVGKKYQLYDAQGKRVGDGEYEDARMFVAELAAVKQGGKWGFINKQGDVAIPCAYEGAESFNLGIAPVAKGGSWGFIDETGKMVVEPTFSWASTLSREGITLVESGKAKRYIQFYKYTLS